MKPPNPPPDVVNRCCLLVVILGKRIPHVGHHYFTLVEKYRFNLVIFLIEMIFI